MKKFFLIIFFLIICNSLAESGLKAQQKVIVLNPYEELDFGNKNHKANFHTHTTKSDGSQDPDVVIDGYHREGYSILALTDHNHVTWPWFNFGKNPEELEMLAVPGNELSRHHHSLSLFTLYPYPVREWPTRKLEVSIREVSENGGLNVLAHPGRYWELDGEDIPDDALQEYVKLFRRFELLIGMEVHNMENRYPRDRKLWDALLQELMPARPVWGFANDDSHQETHIGLNANHFPLENLSESAVREAMLMGEFYFSSVTTHPEDERDADQVPVITAVHYDDEANKLTLKAETNGVRVDESHFTWFSNRGKIVGKGSVIYLDDTKELTTYLRAEIRGSGGVAYTQPFGLADKK
jgi:hypothetical protein